MKKRVENQFPTEWDEARVKRVIAYFEAQSGDEALAEDEAVFSSERQATDGRPRRSCTHQP